MVDEKYIYEQIKAIINKETTENKVETKTKNYIMSEAFIIFTDIEQHHKRRKTFKSHIFLDCEIFLY